jgi:glycerol-3-phosphate dehydrogenase
MSTPSAPGDTRAATCHRLQSEQFDLLVVGGGIVGAGVAALASELGLAVALVDRGDFASATSSASSKLIHGGLRYLRMGDVRLVREALRESETLVRVAAPHLVHRRRFLLPLYEDAPYGRLALRTALAAYRALSGSRIANAFVPGDIAVSLVPSLKLDGLRGVGVYSDAQTDDARLCLSNVRAAFDRGAVVANYAEVVGIETSGSSTTRAEVVDRVSGDRFEVSARALVNATGPWVDEVRRLADQSAGTTVTLSKGAHLTMAAPPDWHAAVTIPVDASRVCFALPWAGTLLLGTTDELYEGDPDRIEVTPRDQEQILTEASLALEPAVLAPERILARFAGLRVLPATGRPTQPARRETMIVRERSGIVSVAGGKLTTYRRIAAAALEALRSELGLRNVAPSPNPLPGAVDAGAHTGAILRDHPELDPDIAEVLARSYGALSAEVLALAEGEPSLLEPVSRGVDVLAAQVVYAREREWAFTPDDVLRRRTTVALRGLDSSDVRDSVAEILADRALHAQTL